MDILIYSSDRWLSPKHVCAITPVINPTLEFKLFKPHKENMLSYLEPVY